jgi:hypothetical protein
VGFESARRLSLLPANPVKRMGSDVSVGSFISGTSAVEYPKASSLALACYKCGQGTAGGVGESSSVDRLTDVLEFRQVRHRRKRFA